MSMNENNRGPAALSVGYDEFGRYWTPPPRSIEEGVKHIRAISRDLEALRQSGDEEAVEGASHLLRHAVLRMAAIGAPTLKRLEHKQKIIVRHADSPDFAWLIDGMIGIALLSDYRMLDLSEEDKQRLREMLPVEADEDD